MASQFYAKTSETIGVFQGYPEFDATLNERFFTLDPPKSENAAENDPEHDEEVMFFSQNTRSTASVITADGSLMAVAFPKFIRIFTGESFNNLVVELPVEIATHDIRFSPSGNYLSTWESFNLDGKNPNHKNCKVYYTRDAATTKPLYEYTHKSQSNWSLQFSKTDAYCCKLLSTNELKIIKLDSDEKSKKTAGFDFSQAWSTIKFPYAISQYHISPSEQTPSIVTFIPEKQGKPACIAIWPFMENEVDTPIISKNFFKADSCQLKWNEQGNAVLGLTTTDFDKSNKSYYGENTLYMLSFTGANGKLGSKSIRVPLNKEGPVHDFTWAPNSKEFAVCYGFMPSTTTFFDLRGNIIHSLSPDSKNTIIYSPNNRYVLVAGFGNLKGLVDILDRNDDFKKLSEIDGSNTMTCKWSPGGEFIMMATTSPRLRVDNCIKIWSYSGKLVFVQEYEELLQADWRSSHAGKDPFFEKKETMKIQAHPSVTKYYLDHPSKAPNAKKAKPILIGSWKKKAANRTVVGGANIVNAKPIGATAGVPGTTKKPANSAKNNNNEKKTPPPSSSSSAGGNTSDVTPEQKKIRSLLKKLRAIKALKDKQDSGEKLEDTQVLKIESEPQVLRELKFLGWSEGDKA
ncbi:hypothetical protein ACO0RG_003430 [Hanseniaspora osmophila]|uniref:Eukaryotic translation initiation factor 2A n=1 Tax=Hanseniaspora osmophila TaxID=56408 RepID=A0A1E5RFG9_9ASCO|nr:Eukaryotic translation initiation factor 2A [Hanseniaspora osmophila]